MFTKLRALVVPLISVAALSVAPGTAHAGLIIPVVTHTMMEDQTGNLLLLGNLFGADYGATLHFTSFVEPDGSAFSYTLDPGTSYLGQALAMSATAAYDDATETWTVSSVGALGAVGFSTLGKQTVKKNDDGTYEVTSDVDHFDDQGVKDKDYHFHVLIGSNFRSSSDEGYITDKFKVKVPNSEFTSVDEYDRDTHDWKIYTTPVHKSYPQGFRLDSAGTSPDTGGAGAFTSRMSPVPEPSTLLMTAVGVLWLTWRRLSGTLGT